MEEIHQETNRYQFDIDLDAWFRMQDQAMPINRAEFEQEYRWLSKAVELLFDIQIFVNHNPKMVSWRTKERDDDLERHNATNVVINLCNDALGSLVNSTRLLLFGTHADAFALLRSAFEACCYAEFFAICPNEVSKHLELEALIKNNPAVNLNSELRKRELLFSSVRTKLEKKDGQNRRGFYARLCNWGAHASPTRVGLRLSPPRGAVLAAASVSTPDWSRAKWTLNCAGGLMAVAKYAFELLFEYYPDWFEGTPLEQRRKSLVREYDEIEARVAATRSNASAASG